MVRHAVQVHVSLSKKGSTTNSSHSSRRKRGHLRSATHSPLIHSKVPRFLRFSSTCVLRHYSFTRHCPINRVMLTTKHWRREYMQKGDKRVAKFMPRYDGPYTIVQAHPESSTYTLDLPNSPNIFPTFHASQLRPYHPNNPELSNCASCHVQVPLLLLMASWRTSLIGSSTRRRLVEESGTWFAGLGMAKKTTSGYHDASWRTAKHWISGRRNELKDSRGGGKPVVLTTRYASCFTVIWSR